MKINCISLNSYIPKFTDNNKQKSAKNYNIQNPVLPADTFIFSNKKISSPFTGYVSFGKRETQTASNKYKIDNKNLISAACVLAPPYSQEYKAIKNIADEGFVCIKDKNSALDIFRNYHKSLQDNSNSKIFILDPKDHNSRKTIGTSNEYMTKWYAEANGLSEESILNFDMLEKENRNYNFDKMNAFIEDKSKGYNNITIVVPDDCAITGRSMAVETARILNSLDLPDKQLTIVFSPLVISPCAQKVFDSISEFDMNKLKLTGALNQRDSKTMEEFFDKYKDKAKIMTPPVPIIEAKPYNETDSFADLNNKLQHSVSSIMTKNGTRKGYGRPGISGTMIAVPSPSGLKCPNNNTYGAAPFALAAGVNPENIKRPSGKVGVKEWQKQMQSILEKIETIKENI
ncbi:MAG: hypothetical protein LUH05_07560 [Candidatus Gastranaerophilales bacterium]|nr:hypothetical protein [Candidatus Gastranaerophilales bacterium]